MKKMYLETGKIVGTHGVKGMVRIQPWADTPEFLCALKRVFLDKQGGQGFEICDARPHGGVVIASLAGIDSIEKAETLRGRILYFDRRDVSLPDGRYYIEDLIGCEVYDSEALAFLGVLSDVSETGANDVWHIRQGEREYLVPAINEVIVSVDTDAGRIVLKPMKGIFDDED